MCKQIRARRPIAPPAVLAPAGVALAGVALALLSACGGGGGGGDAPTGNPARLSATGLEIAPNATSGELGIGLASLPATAPVLVQLTVELPPALTIAPADPLVMVQPVARLDGGRTGNRFTVICGDDRNQAGNPLANGELFRLRLVATTPRQPGEHPIVLRDAIFALSDGSPAATDPNPVTVTATVR